MGAAFVAGVAYFMIAFVAGFALGTVRVLMLVPALGAMVATLLELPVMLGLSWWASGRLLKRFSVPAGLASRLVMGGVGFALLLAAELAVSTLAFGRTVAEHVATYHELPVLTGLVAQLAFGLFPMVRRT